ncbi:hypothetical protein KEM48_012317 [Puccinia striiformis f. sp. tritici PST-130]|nr:hypothetical protein KEM48_012317 [Puccinia striiformis f. sp. tritici PST-130]
MERYVYKRRPDGVNVINIGQTWEKPVLKFAANTGAQAIAGRFTPGNFTNYITRSFKETSIDCRHHPRLDAQAIREASYVNIPVIASVIPMLRSTLSMYSVCEVPLPDPVMELGAVMPDMFFFRDAEEIEAEAADKAAKLRRAGAGIAAAAATMPSVEVDWTAAEPQPIGLLPKPVMPSGAPQHLLLMPHLAQSALIIIIFHMSLDDPGAQSLGQLEQRPKDPAGIFPSRSDHSQKRKFTGRLSIKLTENKQVTCEREDDVNDVIAVDGHDQRLSILKNIPNNNSKPICLIDQIFPPVTEQHNNHVYISLLRSS